MVCDFIAYVFSNDWGGCAIRRGLPYLVNLMTYRLVAESDDRPIDHLQNLLIQKRDRVRECGRRHRQRVKTIRQTRQAASCHMVGGQVGQPVKIDVQPLYHHGQHQDLSNIHSWTAVATVDVLAMGCLHPFQNLIAGVHIAPECLQRRAKHFGIVPGLGIEGQCLNRDGTRGGCGSKVFRITVSSEFEASTSGDDLRI